MKTHLSRVVATATLFTALATAPAQPVVTKQPTNQSVSLGASAKFRVSATSTNPPIRYQWRFAAVMLAGQTNSPLTLTNVQLINAGDYDAVLTDGSASVTSRVAHLEVDPTFTKITEGNVVNDFGYFHRGAWGDFNNDGFLDLFVNDLGGTNVFYLNNTNGTFTKITRESPAQGADAHTISSWVDYDNDGNLDLCVPAGLTAPTPGHISLYHNNGDSTFSRASAGSLTSQAGYFGWGEWVDYDNDGFVDLLISNIADLDVGGKNVLFRNNGDGTFTSAAAGAVTSDSLGTWGLIWGDYDNDGFMDLFVVSHFASSLNRLYHNERNGTFTRVLTNIVATDRWPSSGGNGAAWADYDNDGFSDLFVIADSDTLNRLYHNSGNGTFTRVTSGPMLSHSPGGVSNGCSWGDYDNDGYIDLFVSAYGGRNQLFHNNGNGTFTQILSGSPANDGGPGVIYVAPSWVDYDNDGFVDLFVAGGSTDTRPGSNLLYHNNGNSNAWLEVKCVGTVSNRAAIGARVRALATIAGKRFWQTREIKQGGGHNSMPLVAHFGLGDATNADVLRIEWPSGIVQEFQGVASTQIVTVTEPARLAASATSGAPQFTLKGGLGFRYDVEVSENLRNWTTLGTLTVTNARAAVSITDADPPASGHRFYRALQVGQ